MESNQNKVSLNPVLCKAIGCKFYGNPKTDGFCSKCYKDVRKTKRKENLKNVGMFALKTAGISAVVIGGIAVAVPAIGFTSAGVAAGSLAASFQSAVLGGTIASGSAFAVLQSVGAAGLAATTQAGIVAGSAVIAGAHTLANKVKKNNNGHPSNENSSNKNSTGKGDKVKDGKPKPKLEQTVCEGTSIQFNEAHDNSINATRTMKASNMIRKDKQKENTVNSAQINLVEQQWNDVQLDDDETISKSIALNLK